MTGTDSMIGAGSRRWPVGVLGVCAVAWAVVLVVGEKPWELGIAARAAVGEVVPLGDFLKEGFWIAALFNLVAAVGLILTARWWLDPRSARVDSEETPGDLADARTALRLPKWFLPLLVVTLGLAAWFRVPALGHSLWNDEEYTLRRYVWGAWKVEKDESLAFSPVGWKTTLWFDRGANNHVGFSIPAKASLLAWHRLTGARPGEFSEAALRLPAFLLGLGSIALVAWVVAARGHPVIGLMAAAVLAADPWHLRYSVEARGYASLLFFSVLAMHWLDRAMRSGRWRFWIAYAAAQFAYLYSFPGAVYLAVALNAWGLGWLACRRSGRQDANLGHAGSVCHPGSRGMAGAARLIAANVLSAMVFVQAMGPCFHQIRLYLGRDIARGAMGGDWFLDVWSHFTAGVRWPADPPGQPLWATGSALVNEPVFAGVVFGLMPVLVLAGGVAAVRRGLGLFVLPAFAAAGLAYAHTALTGNFLFSWYLIFVMPGLAVAVAAPFGCLSARSLVAGGLCLGCWFAGTHTPRRLIRDQARQPLRAAAVLLRGDAYPGAQDPRPVTVSVGTSAGQFRSYDPRIHFFDRDGDPADPAAFEEIVADARAAGRPVKVILAGRAKEERVNARMVAAVTDPGRFRLTGRIFGLEELFSFELYEYREELP